MDAPHFARRRAQGSARSMAGEKVSIGGSAFAEGSHAALEGRLVCGRLDLDSGALARKRLFDNQVDIFHVTSKRGHPPPATAREHELDQKLEVRPVEMTDQLARCIDQHLARFPGRRDQRFLLTIDPPDQIVVLPNCAIVPRYAAS